jgi:ubiquinone/menaquinone biosynthesis C-methylase UbiE
MKRRVTAELLDDDLGTPEEIAVSLRDLRHINDWFGGTRTTITLLRQVAREAGRRELSLLEVGAGRGDVPFEAQRVLAREGITLRITLLDRVWSHLPGKVILSVSGDALQLPFRDDSFDVVSSSLFAHHFDPDSLPLLLRESQRVSRRAVLVNDLVRSRLHLLLVYLGLPLFRSRITWHDAPASVRRAYTVEEMRTMLTEVEAGHVEASRHFLFRMGALIWKQDMRADAEQPGRI